MTLGNVDRRILGAFRCVDAVSLSAISEGLEVTGTVLDIRRNGSGTYVVFDGPGLHELTTAFEVTDPWPAAVGFDVAVAAKQGRYLPRRVQVKVPRKLAPASDPDSVLVPQDVPMYPNAAAPISPNWAVVRLSATQAGTTKRLPWAVALITRDSDGGVLASGMGDDRGEMLLAVPGVRVTASANPGGAVVATTIDATVTVVYDPGVLARPASWLLDPDSVLQDLKNPAFKTASRAVSIGRGTRSNFEMPIPL